MTPALSLALVPLGAVKAGVGSLWDRRY